MATSGLVSSAEVTDLVNDELPEVYRLLVEVGPPDYYSASTTITTTAVGGLFSTAYALPADFFQETTVYVTDSSQFKRPLLPIQGWELARVRGPQATYSVTLEYVPSPPVMAADGDAFDGFAGWDSLLTCRVARRLLQKRKADSGSLDSEIGQLTDHLTKGARRANGPRYIRDMDDVSVSPLDVPSLSPLSHYRVRGGNIELYQSILAYP